MFYKKNIFFRNFSRFLLSLFVVVFIFSILPNSALANDTFGLNFIEGEIALGSDDPRPVVARIINIALSILGILAVTIVIYGGFIWMTSGGEEDKIDKAKKTLKAGVIGLIIILASWGIASFVLRQLGQATGVFNNVCVDGTTKQCGCGGVSTCSNGSWGSCVGSSCLPGGEGSSCTSAINNVCSPDPSECNTGLICNDSCVCAWPGQGDPCGNIEQGVCTPDDNDCSNPNLFCDVNNCTCVSTTTDNYSELGDPCNDGGSCSAVNNICNPNHGLTCDPNNCVCVGNPVITGISPVGGFCNNNINTPCINDSSCPSGDSCNKNIPNSSSGNLITIFGYNFGDFDPNNSKIKFFKKEEADFSCGDNLNYNNYSYKTVKINNVCWLAENLRTTNYNNNTPIAYPGSNNNDWINNTTGAYAWLNNNINSGYGALYNWYAVNSNKLCPVGWKVPSDNDWYLMEKYIDISINNPNSLGWRGQFIGPMLRSSNGWANEGGGQDDYNFSALPGGYRSSIGTFPSENNSRGYWWTKTEHNSSLAFSRSLTSVASGFNSIYRGIPDKKNGYSVRCILDESYEPFISGQLPNTVNPSCINTWSNNQIIILMPGTTPFMSGDQIEIEVVTKDNTSDRSGDDFGPKLDLLKFNSIQRPGLCGISDSEAKMNDDIVYYGLNLNNSKAYFGNSINNVIGFSPNHFSNSTYGSTKVPNLSTGNMSTFAKKGEVISNFLDFKKLAEAPQGPSISSVFPVEGASGQYVTIYGSGFNNIKGDSNVYFRSQTTSSDAPASFNFPPVCLQSVWNNNQIIVKVPDGLANGNYNLAVDIFSWSGEIISGQTFVVDSTIPLKPGICKISPTSGPYGILTSLWGEYFGEQALAIFNSNKPTNNTNTTDDAGAKKLSVVVPADSITGPVKVSRAGVVGNEINFNVSYCLSNSDCLGSSGICCPITSIIPGACVDNIENCYGEAPPSSFFQWGFSTGFETFIPTIPPDVYSCASYSFCPTTAWICPNSPGVCSLYSGGGVISMGAGSCNSDCSGFSSLCGSNGQLCSYDNNNDKCVRNNYNCDLPQTVEYNLGVGIGTTTASAICKEYPNYFNKTFLEISVSTSCPSGWLMIAPGKCINISSLPTSSTNSTCSLCPSGGSCTAGASSSPNEGVCISPRLCSGNYKCEGSTCQKPDIPSCQCCCDKTENTSNGNPACCSPLICDNVCGAGGDFGLCSGCKISTTTSTSVRDLACNCLGISGKYCDVDQQYPSGACLDCTSLGQTACIEHSSTCCWDAKAGTSGLCRGGVGNESIWGSTSSLNFGFCPYYDCDSSSITSCAISTPDPNGTYSSIESCDAGCLKNCSQFNDFSDCQISGDCCWKTATSTPASYQSIGSCVAGNILSSDPGNQNFGLCAYYNCVSPGSACQQTAFGDYLSQNICDNNCQSSSSDFGNSCTSLISTTTCKTSCSFDCLQSNGLLGVFGNNSDCGVCCCNPFASVDQCSQINSKLNCVANKGLCSGPSRGLCCGCSNDADCVNAPNVPELVGCGFDACCKARPRIQEDPSKNASLDVFPEHGSSDVCRNAIIEINFDRRMDQASFENNILLLEETSGICSPGTYFIGQADFYQNNKKSFLKIVKNIINKSFDYIGKLTGKSVLASPSSSKNYCATLGISSFEHLDNNRTKVYFKPNTLLKAGAKYFVVVKGDEDLNSVKGVKSFDGVGMNGLGYFVLGSGWQKSLPNSPIVFNSVSYKNSYIWHFVTRDVNTSGQGICTIDYVTVSPSSYLFKTTANDINENDLDPNHSTFDSVRDRDKVYFAKAYSSDSQRLYPTAQYNWTWEWTVSNSNILELANDNEVVSWEKNMENILVKAKPNVTEGKSDITAKVKITADSVFSAGDNTSKKVPAYLFVCNNTWPPFDEVNNTWEPWKDVNAFSQFNYEFYYCRDSGSPETSDDLPAFLSDLAITQGQSLIKVCSNQPTQTCNSDSNCPAGGLCLVSFLKETYFFKEKIPRFIDNISIQDSGLGGSLNVYWSSPQDGLVDKFKVYYGYSNNTISQHKIVDLSSCNIDFGNYSCYTELTGLVNNQQYFVRVTALSSNLAETNPSQTVFGTPSQSTVINNSPTNLDVEVLPNKVVKLTWTAPVGYNVSRYKVYRGTSPGVYGTSFFTIDSSPDALIDLSSYSSDEHSFAVSAISDSEHESDKSSDIFINILYPNCKNVTTTCVTACFYQNKIYNLVDIDGQCWFKENLQATKYNNGNPIANLISRSDWLSATTGAYSCVNNDPNKCLQLGALYNGYALDNNNICPVGWRVPSEDDWYLLETNLKDAISICPADRSEIYIPFPCSPAGQKIKTNTWGGDNSSGFSALQSGLRRSTPDGYDFTNLSGAFFWSNKKIQNSRFRRMLTNNESGIRSNGASQNSGHSVRCIKN